MSNHNSFSVPDSTHLGKFCKPRQGTSTCMHLRPDGEYYRCAFPHVTSKVGAEANCSTDFFFDNLSKILDGSVGQTILYKSKSSPKVKGKVTEVVVNKDARHLHIYFTKKGGSECAFVVDVESLHLEEKNKSITISSINSQEIEAKIKRLIV